MRQNPLRGYLLLQILFQIQDRSRIFPERNRPGFRFFLSSLFPVLYSFPTSRIRPNKSSGENEGEKHSRRIANADIFANAKRLLEESSPRRSGDLGDLIDTRCTIAARSLPPSSSPVKDASRSAALTADEAVSVERRHGNSRDKSLATNYSIIKEHAPP